MDRDEEDTMARRIDIEKKLISKYKAPRGNVLFVLHDEVEELAETTGGILIPHAVENKHMHRVGTVIAAGSGIGSLSVGDRVLMDKRYGINVTHEDQVQCRMVMVSEDQVEAKLEGVAERDDYDHVKHGLSW